MYDAEDHREVSENWRDYVAGFKESYEVYSWVWRELTSAEAKRWSKKMAAWMFVTVLLYLFSTYFIGITVDAATTKDFQLGVMGISGLGVSYVLVHFTDYMTMRCREWVFGLNMGEIDQKMNRLFFEKSVGQHMKENSALSASNVEKGRGRISELQNMMIFEGLNSVMTLVIALFFLTIISPVAGLIMVAVTAFYMFTSVYLNHRVQAVCTPLDASFRHLNRWRVERWDEIERVKANAKESEEELAQRAAFDSVIEHDRAFWIGYIGQISLRGTVADIAVIVVLSYTFYMIVYAQAPWQVGTMVPIFMWCRNVRNNLWRIGHIEHRLNWNLPSVKSTMEALTMKPDIVDVSDAVDLPDGPVEIEVMGLTHGFEEGGESTKILKNVSLKLEAGKRTAIIGLSGAGKSTFMRMLLRHMDPQEGTVYVNGVDLKKLQLSSFLSATGYISQKAQVFDGSIRDNLLYGLSPGERAEVTDEQIFALMDRLNLHLEDRLKQGLDTVVGRSGVKLSGGEAQRVMIAAAAMKNPRLMVIDEATSSLDVLTEAGIHEGLEKVLTGITAVIITHRLPTVRHLCDRFVVLRPASELVNGDSQVEAIADSFEELYKISPTFRNMADTAELAIS